MIFSEDQHRAFELYKKGQNVFITGPGGSGKSALLRKIYQDANMRGTKVRVTALTGCAAILLGCKARTIHSFAGIGLGNGTIEENVARVMKNRGKCSSWRAVQLLVIDEVSMMSKKLMEILDAVARAVRKNPNELFGGIQVIFSGDFFQIRPVADDRDPETGLFCFESPLWDRLFVKGNQVCLRLIYRQHDKVYAEILNAIREGKLTEEHMGIMRKRVRAVDLSKDTKIRPVKLFPTRRQVEALNTREMDLLPNDVEHTYDLEVLTDMPMSAQEMKKRTTMSKEEIQREIDYLRKNVVCEESIRLRVGAQVMYIINKELSDKTYLCNGSQGVVIGFDEATHLPIVRFHNGHIEMMEKNTWKSEFAPGIGISQIPLIVSFSVTIHKMQGATLDAAEVDVGRNIFECGQTYVALSRIRSLDGLYLNAFEPSCIYIDPKVIEFYKNLEIV